MPEHSNLHHDSGESNKIPGKFYTVFYTRERSGCDGRSGSSDCASRSGRPVCSDCADRSGRSGRSGCAGRDEKTGREGEPTTGVTKVTLPKWPKPIANQTTVPTSPVRFQPTASSGV